MKKIIAIILLLIPIKTLAMNIPDLYSSNVLLYDMEEDKILYEKGSNEIINIASLTKIMTVITAIENIDNLEAKIVITKEMLSEVPSDASVAGLKIGDEVTYLDLLYASILPSGADATTALAFGISGSSKNFVKLMNEKAESLCLENTNFVNVTGYDAENHYSTPYDVLLFLNYALQNPLFKEIYETKSYILTNGLEVKSTVTYYSEKGTLDITPIIGSKTGYTSKAGLCMSSIIKVVDKELILLTFGAPRVYGKGYNVEDALTIVNYLNSNYRKEKVFSKGEVVKTIPVINSSQKEYQIKVKTGLEIYTDEVIDKDKKIVYEGLDSLSYKNKKGEKIGTITYYYQDYMVKEDVILDENLRLSLVKYLYNNPVYLIPFLIVIILSLLVVYIKRRGGKKNVKNKKQRFV